MPDGEAGVDKVLASAYDVIVVGAGAAGAAAAYFLARAGLCVLVVEKARLPRHKPCGGAIPRPTLESLGAGATSVIRVVPDAVRFAYAGLAPIEVPLPGGPVAMVRRSEFDAWLLAQSGAEVLDGIGVSCVEEGDEGVWVQAGDKRLGARYLVGADGAASVVARCLKLRPRRRIGGALQAEVPLEGRADLEERFGRTAHFSLGIVPRGYAWVFPKGDHLSVGVASFCRGRVGLRLALEREMQRLRIPMDGVRPQGHPLPCYQAPPWPFWHRRPQERLSTRRCVLVGDAAGLVDPLIGEGIRYALASARLAAEAIGRDDLTGYEAAVWREIGHSLATAGLAADLFYRWPRACYRLGVRNAATVRQFLDVLTERASYQGIGRRLVATTAAWLIRGCPPVESRPAVRDE